MWPIANFRSPERFVAVDRAAAGTRLRAELGIGPDVPLLGLVGHLIEQKRPERALAVLARVRARGDCVTSSSPGAARSRRIRRRRATRGARRPFVHVLGHRDDVELLLGGIDLLLLTSDSEGIPGIVIEA